MPDDLTKLNPGEFAEQLEMLQQGCDTQYTEKAIWAELLRRLSRAAMVGELVEALDIALDWWSSVYLGSVDGMGQSDREAYDEQFAVLTKALALDAKAEAIAEITKESDNPCK